jgi:AcrR family transcriptional regulator
MNKRKDIVKVIIEQTSLILKDEGSSGLTMRKVATNSGITLSNLQYHFADRTKLLQATVEHFFQVCEETILEELKAIEPKDQDSTDRFLKKLVGLLIIEDIDHYFNGIFREIWALSLRNKELEDSLLHFYKNFANWLTRLIAGFTKHPDKITSLLIPYADGYSITGRALPLSRKEIINMLLKIIIEFKN